MSACSWLLETGRLSDSPSDYSEFICGCLKAFRPAGHKVWLKEEKKNSLKEVNITI